jgi:hypothetical protein
MKIHYIKDGIKHSIISNNTKQSSCGCLTLTGTWLLPEYQYLEYITDDINEVTCKLCMKIIKEKEVD